MTETTPESTPAATAATAPAPSAVGLIAALETRVQALEAKTASWIVKHAAVLAAVGGFIAGIGFALIARHLHL